MADAVVLPGGAGLGTAPMGGPGWQLDWGPSDPEESVAAVRAAVAAGAGWIDTAPFYGWGQAEEIIGAALDGMACRPVALTKCGDVPGPDGRVYDDHRPAVIRADVRASLRRLRCRSSTCCSCTTRIRARRCLRCSAGSAGLGRR